MELEIYDELGLGKNEAKAYETLIEFGKLGAGEISQRSGVSYSRIYDVLDSLISKGLVKVIPEKTKKFIASDPENLDKIIKEKEKTLMKAKEKLKDLKKFYDVKEKNPVVVSYGRKGFYKLVDEHRQANKYEYSIKWTSEFRPEWVRGRSKKIKKGVDFKTLARYDDETKKDVNKWFKIEKNIKKLENDGVAMSIIDDEEVMLGLIKSNVTMLIKDKSFAKLMKKMFKNTYENAEKLK